MANGLVISVVIFAIVFGIAFGAAVAFVILKYKRGKVMRNAAKRISQQDYTYSVEGKDGKKEIIDLAGQIATDLQKSLQNAPKREKGQFGKEDGKHIS